MHFFFIRGGMKIVRIEKNPIEAAGEQFPDCGLSRAGDTHYENDHAKL